MKAIDDALLADFRDQAFGYTLDDDANADFSPTPGTPHIQLRNFLNEEVALTIASHSVVTGAYQIIVYWPEGVGEFDAKTLMDTIFAAYPVGRAIARSGQTVRITGRHRFQAYPEDGWFKVGANLTYRAFLSV